MYKVDPDAPIPLVKFTLVNAKALFATVPLILNVPPAATVILPVPALKLTLFCCISNVPLTVKTPAVEAIVAALANVIELLEGTVNPAFIVRVPPTVIAPLVDLPLTPLTVKLLYANAGIT
ncbi:hypothetical protein EBX93_18790 [bacterium]|nr:hypothetical protein [bacterium]